MCNDGNDCNDFYPVRACVRAVAAIPMRWYHSAMDAANSENPIYEKADDAKRRAIACAKSGGSVAAQAQAAQRHPDTLNDWMRDDARFRADITAARADGFAARAFPVQDALFQKAAEGENWAISRITGRLWRQLDAGAGQRYDDAAPTDAQSVKDELTAAWRKVAVNAQRNGDAAVLATAQKALGELFGGWPAGADNQQFAQWLNSEIEDDDGGTAGFHSPQPE